MRQGEGLQVKPSLSLLLLETFKLGLEDLHRNALRLHSNWSPQGVLEAVTQPDWFAASDLVVDPGLHCDVEVSQSQGGGLNAEDLVTPGGHTDLHLTLLGLYFSWVDSEGDSEGQLGGEVVEHGDVEREELSSLDGVRQPQLREEILADQQAGWLRHSQAGAGVETEGLSYPGGQTVGNCHPPTVNS